MKPYLLRLLFLVLILISLLRVGQAQWGVSGYYLQHQAEGWTSTLTDNNNEPIIELPGAGWQVGLDYWFRLKNKRVEFLPTLSYSTAEQGQSSSSLTKDYRFTSTQVGFFLHTNFYLLDFSGDCDCPTFSKEGPTFRKGLFVQVSPGIGYYRFAAQDYPIDLDDQHLAPGIGLGLGLDLGISDLITITPMLRATYYPSVSWEGLPGNGEDVINLPGVSETTTLWQYQAGLRIGFRPDKKRRW